MCGKDSAVDPSAGIGDISDKDHICNRSKTDQACIGQENDDKKDQIDQKLGCSKCQSDMGDYSLRKCRTWICTEMDLDQPGESESLDENSKYDHDQSVLEFFRSCKPV